MFSTVISTVAGTKIDVQHFDLHVTHSDDDSDSHQITNSDVQHLLHEQYPLGCGKLRQHEGRSKYIVQRPSEKSGQTTSVNFHLDFWISS